MKINIDIHVVSSHCHNCGEAFKDGDKVKSTIIGKIEEYPYAQSADEKFMISGECELVDVHMSCVGATLHLIN